MPKGQKGLSTEQIRELARDGAEAILKRLRAEITAIERTFPELANPSRRQRLVRRSVKAVQKQTRNVRKQTRKMSAAGRKAVSERMKRYWAERRKATAKTRRK